MIDLLLDLPGGRPPCLVFIGAHSDDIEIGCGGTVLELVRAYPDAEIHWIVLSTGSGPDHDEREREARRSAEEFLRGATNTSVVVKDFRMSFFPTDLASIKEYFEELKRTIRPDVVLAHHTQDRHQDHRVVGELVWNTFRDHLVLEYEIVKYDGGLGSPSFFLPLPETTLARKIEILMDVFGSQHGRTWFTPDTFRGLARIRGIECNAPEGSAEAFYARKVVLGTRPAPSG